MPFGDANSLGKRLAGFFRDKRERDSNREKSNEYDGKTITEVFVHNGDKKSKGGYRNHNNDGMNHEWMDGKTTDGVKERFHNYRI